MIKTDTGQIRQDQKKCDIVSPQKQDNYNYGVHFLRIILAFAVIMAHFLDKNSKSIFLPPLLFLINCAVPVFMFLSFLFYDKTLRSPTFLSIKKTHYSLGLAVPGMGNRFLGHLLLYRTYS